MNYWLTTVSENGVTIVNNDTDDFYVLPSHIVCAGHYVPLHLCLCGHVLVSMKTQE